MTPPTAFAFARQRIIVADEDSAAVLCAAEDLAVRECHLVISSNRANGVRRVDAIGELHEHLPELRRGSILGHSLEALR